MRATVASIRRSAGARRRCQLAGSATWPQRQPHRSTRSYGSASDTTAVAVSLDVVPEGTITIRTTALDLSILTETEQCDSISFEASGGGSEPGAGSGNCVAGLQLTAQGELAAELVGSAAVTGGSDHASGSGQARPGLRGLIPAKYNVDVTSVGGDVELGFLEGAATIDTSPGGRIAVDKITSAEIHLASGGGDVAAR